MENNYLCITDFGVFHVFFSDNSIYIRKYDGNKWSQNDLVLNSSLKDFDVCCIENRLFILAEKSDGSLFFSEYSGREKTQKNILSSKNHTTAIHNIRLIYAGDTVHAFYILNHDSKKLLIHHLPQKTQTPSVICEVTNSDYLALADKGQNINLFFEKDEKSTRCVLTKEKNFAYQGKESAESFAPLAACCFDEKICMLSLQNGNVLFLREDIQPVTVCPLPAQNITPEIFVYNNKIYLLLINYAAVHIFVSEDSGKTFAKLMPQTVTRTPRLKTLNIRKKDFNITLPCNAERGYIRSMVIPLEKIISGDTALNVSDLVKKLKMLEEEILQIKKTLQKL